MFLGEIWVQLNLENLGFNAGIAENVKDNGALAVTDQILVISLRIS